MTREEAWAWFTAGASRHSSRPVETIVEARAAFDHLYDAAVSAIPTPTFDPSHARTFAEIGRCEVCVGMLPCAKHPVSECGAFSGDRRGIRCVEKHGHEGPHVSARGTRFARIALPVKEGT